MRPDRLVVEAYFFRGLRLWLATRALLTVVMLFGTENPLEFSVLGHAEVVLLSVFVCFIDTRRHRERALLGNLAVHPMILSALFAAPALAGESVFALVARAVR